MNKIDRQLAIALLLQNRKTINAQKIAEYFEISVRTVYRDIQVLSEAGLPIVALPGEGYAIMDGYKLPPLMFERPELLALHVGLDLVGKHGDRSLREAGQRARVKMESVLPPLVRLQYDAIVDDVLVQTIPPDETVFKQEWVSVAERAIREKKAARIQRRKGGPAEEVHPLLLYFCGNEWLVIAEKIGGSQIDFPLSALKSFDVLERSFLPPADFTFSRYWAARRPAEA
jgi:predicted DNA-binding transcriptional regulator YafY